MPDRRTLSLTLGSSDAAAVAAMAAALALPVEDFLAGVVAGWVAKPKNYRRFAKRLIGDDAGDERRKQVKGVVRALKRRQREAPAKPAADGKTTAKPKAKAKAKAKAKRVSSAKRARKPPTGIRASRNETSPQLTIAAPA